MTLVFHGEPFEKNEPLVALYLNGRDEAAASDVELCVVFKVLRVCCGAESFGTMRRAFEAHRERIEVAAIQKYEAGDVEELPDWVVVRLEVADL